MTSKPRRRRIVSRAATFVIKAAVGDPRAASFTFSGQKTMYGGKHVAKGDTIFVFASENEGGPGLVATGVVTSARAIARKRGILRQTPRVSITLRRTALTKRRLGRNELKPFSRWNDGRPETELNFKLYRQATNKIAGISDEAAAFLRGFFEEGRSGAARADGSTKTEIFRATRRDRGAVEALLEEIAREEGSGIPETAADGLRRSLASFDVFASDSAWLLGARREGELVGYAVAVRVPKLDARVGFLFVDELHVLRAHRRHGVASALVEATWRLAAERGLHGVRLLVRSENTAARRLYAKLGFTEQRTSFCERVR